MLQRIFIHISLILLFAFTQMGVTTHEISHLADSKQQQQQDQHGHEKQCSQCLSYSHAASAPLAYNFTFIVIPTKPPFIASNPASTALDSSYFYSARAPPIASQA
jgi:hypothetical protein